MLGEQIIPAAGKQVPFAFEIAYDPARIDGRLSFISDQRCAVITRGAPMHVYIVLKPVDVHAPR